MADVQGNLLELQQVIIQTAEGKSANPANTEPDQTSSTNAKTDND